MIDLTALGDSATAALVRQAIDRFYAWKFEADDRLLERALEERRKHEHEPPRSPYFNICARLLSYDHAAKSWKEVRIMLALIVIILLLLLLFGGLGILVSPLFFILLVILLVIAAAGGFSRRGRW
jgi:hypothetical protein